MAGHSKFKNIMHRKGRADSERSKLFSKLSREITVAAKLGLPDPNMNARLRLAVAWMQLYRKWQRGEMTGSRYAGFETLALAILTHALTAFSKDAT